MYKFSLAAMDLTLYLDINRPETSSAIRQVFVDLEYLGHIKKYGNCCLFISTLVQRILQAKGFTVELKTCNAIVEKSDQRFLLGGKQFAKPGQLATHVVCIVDQSILLDFGLGNARRDFYPEFFQGVVLPYQDSHEVLSRMSLGKNTGLYYIHDEPPADFEEQQVSQAAAVEEVLLEFSKYQKNRFRFCLERAFRSMGIKSGLSRPNKKPRSQVLQAKFDDTFSA